MNRLKEAVCLGYGALSGLFVIPLFVVRPHRLLPLIAILASIAQAVQGNPDMIWYHPFCPVGRAPEEVRKWHFWNGPGFGKAWVQRSSGVGGEHR